MREKVMCYELIVIRGALCFLLLGIGIISFGCGPKNRNEYSKKDNYYFKLLSIGDGKIKPDTSDYLWIDAACYTLKDSVFWDTKHNAFQSFFIKQNTFSFAKHIFTLAEGDSVQYLVPSATLFKEVFGFTKPADFSKNDSAVKFSVRILRIISPDEYTHVADSLRANTLARENEEYGQINNYVTGNFNGSYEFSKDAFMQKTDSTRSDTIKWGSRVSILYMGYYLDGRLVDFTPDKKPFEFKMGQEGQVIEGLKLALYHLKKGEKAKIILPSRLAFGSKGNSNGSVAPYTPLLYEVQVLDVKN